MTARRLLLVLATATGLAAVAVLGKDIEPAAARMTAAADKLLASLDATQRTKVSFDFDDRERTNWHFVPHQANKKPLRKGLRLEELNAEQQAAALKLLEAGTSPSGFTKVSTIMSLEKILRDLEKNGVNVRNPGWYFFSVFGTPSKSGKRGWRVEGHHLSINFTLDHGRVVGATPFFFGANPAEAKAGDRKGQRTLPEAEVPAGKLITSLDKAQQAIAMRPKQFPEIEEAKSAAKVGKPVGLPASQMSGKQVGLLLEILEGYAARMPPEVAAVELARLKEAGVGTIHFAYAREDNKPGQPYTYHVQGPTFLIEFLNVQSDSAHNPANHIHSSWRDLPADFGLATP